MALGKMHPAEKEQLCERIYGECIVKSAEVLELYERYSNTINGNFPDSCYTNFRDALFHFRKLVHVSEEREILCHEFAIKEHLSRALTDAASSVIDVITWVAENLLRDDEVLDEWKAQIRLLLHKLKNLFLRKRLVGMMVSGEEMKVSHEEILQVFEEFLDFSDNNCREIFAQYSYQYNERIKLGIEREAYEKVVKRLLKEHKMEEGDIKRYFSALTDEDMSRIQNSL